VRERFAIRRSKKLTGQIETLLGEDVKSYIDQLAVLGGTPAFQANLHVGRPNISNSEHIGNVYIQNIDG
jgi:hypothetical protein